MVQTRNVGYGALVQSSDLPSDIAALFPPGRLQGMVFSATAADQITVSPGSCLLPDGVVILEDQSQIIQFNNPAFATNFTLLYQLQNTNVIGGSAANLTLQSGIIQQSTLTDAVILGWIIYPGNSVALDPSFFIQPAPVSVNPPSGVLDYAVYLPPFVEALRPPTEGLRNGTNVKTVRFSNLNLTQSLVTTFGGVPARILGATVVTDQVSIPSSSLNNDLFYLNKTFVVTGNITNGSSTITNISDTSKITVGQVVGNGNNGIPLGATVATAPVSNTITISGNATATATATSITFADTLYSLSTSSTPITAGLPQALVVTSGLATNKFVLGSTDALTVGITTSSIPPTGTASGEFDIAVQVPATSGNWQEGIVTLGNETAYQFSNISNSPLLVYEFRLPFVISGQGQPNKLVSRLNVNLNCIVTFEIIVQGVTLTLSPVSGSVANTGGLITVEMAIPNLSSVTWKTGTTAFIDVAIQAQTGGSAAFSYIGLTLEDAPYPLFS